VATPPADPGAGTAGAGTLGAGTPDDGGAGWTEGVAGGVRSISDAPGGAGASGEGDGHVGGEGAGRLSGRCDPATIRTPLSTSSATTPATVTPTLIV
jgi:hypothetical protein